MKSFFDGTDQENSKKQERKNGGKKKKRFLHTWRFPYLCLLHQSGTPLGYRSCDPSSGEPTQMGTSLPTKSCIEEQFSAAIRHALSILLRASPKVLSTRPCKNISHIQGLVIYFYPTPLIKLKLRLQTGGRLLIATHLDQSNHLANRDKE